MKKTVKKLLNLLLVVTTIVTVFVILPETIQARNYVVEIDDSMEVNDIERSVNDAINLILRYGGDSVTITGGKYNVQNQLSIAIPSGVTVVWEADFISNNSYGGYLIWINSQSGSSGTFELADGRIENILGYGIRTYDSFTGKLNISGGEIYTSMVALTIGKNTKVNISGGTIEAVQYVITDSGSSDSTSFLTISDGRIALASTASNGITIQLSYTDVLITGGIIEGYTYALFCQQKNNVKITGGLITSRLHAISTYGKLTVTGGMILPNASNNYAAAVYNNFAVYLAGTCSGRMLAYGNSMVIQADTLTVPKSRNGTTTGLVAISGDTNGTAKWNTTGTIPSIDIYWSGGIASFPWGTIYDDTKTGDDPDDPDDPDPDDVFVAYDKYTQVTLKISAVKKAVSYNVYRSTNKLDYKKVGTTTTTTFIDSRLKAGKTYYYSTKAKIKRNGKTSLGGFSNVKKMTTAKLPAVTDVTVTSPGYGQLEFNWANKENESAIQIYISTSKSKNAIWTVCNVNKTKFLLKNLKKGKTYYYKTRYVHFNGTTSYGPFSSVKSVVVGNETRYSLNDNYTEVEVEITPVSGAVEYQIFRATKKDGKYKQISTLPDSYEKYIDSRLKANTTYYYKIKPVTLDTKSKKVVGKFGAVITKKTNTLPVPNDVSAVAENNAIKFNYENKRGIRAIQIWVAKSDKKSTKWSKHMVSKNAFLLAKLAKNKKYYYKIRYVYYNGSISYSEFSPVETITTK